MKTEQREKSALDKQREEDEWWIEFSTAERELGYKIEWKEPEDDGPGGWTRVRVDKPEDESIGDVFKRAVKYMIGTLSDVDMVGFEEVWKVRSVPRSEFSGPADGEVLFSPSDAEVLSVGTSELRDKAETEAFNDAYRDPEFRRILEAVAQGRPEPPDQPWWWLGHVRELWDYARSPDRKIKGTPGRKAEKGLVLDRGRLALSCALQYTYCFAPSQADDVVALAEVTAQMLCPWPGKHPKEDREQEEARQEAEKFRETTLEILAHAPGVLPPLYRCRNEGWHVGILVETAAGQAKEICEGAANVDDAIDQFEEIVEVKLDGAQNELKRVKKKVRDEKEKKDKCKELRKARNRPYPAPLGGATIGEARGRVNKMLKEEGMSPLPSPPFDPIDDSDEGEELKALWTRPDDSDEPPTAC